jgi:serine protease inhibitor
VFQLLLLASAVWSSRSAAAIGAAAEEAFFSANAGFTFDLLKQLALDENLKRNLLVAPYPVWAMLRLVLTGANAGTEARARFYLRTHLLSQADLNSCDDWLNDSLTNMPEGPTIRLANCIWYPRSLALNLMPTAANARSSRTVLTPFDPSGPPLSDTVAAWASKTTSGKFTNGLDQIPLSRNAPTLFSTAYFDGRWNFPVAKQETSLRPFTVARRRTRKVPMVCLHGRFFFQDCGIFQAVELPYEQTAWDTVMLVLLPKTNFSLGKLISSLDAEQWRKTFLSPFHGSQDQRPAEPHEIEVLLPRLKIACYTDLTRSLRSLGLRPPFAKAGSSTPPTPIGAVAQAAVLEINEDSTSDPPPTVTPNEHPLRLVINRPFLFVIQSELRRSIFFIGAVVDP